MAKCAIFYLEGNIPLGIVFWDQVDYKLTWFFRDAERDIKSNLWMWADILFFKIQDWITDSKSPAKDEFWDDVKKKMPKCIQLIESVNCEDSNLWTKI